MAVYALQPENLGRAMKRLFGRTGGPAGAATAASRVLPRRVGSAPEPARGSRAADACDTLRIADVVVVAALDEEYAAMAAALGCVPQVDSLGRRVVTANIAGRRIAVESLYGVGNVGAASAATTIVLSWRAHYLILVGITGGIESADVRVGDIVIADQVVGYESSKLMAGGMHRRPEVYRPDFDLLTFARAVDVSKWSAAIRAPSPRPGQQPRVRFGTVLSGEKVVADADAALGLRRSWPKAIAIEMEGYGAALAAYRHGIRFLMIKGVSDLADSNKNDSWRAYAAEVAARFTTATLENMPGRHDPA